MPRAMASKFLAFGLISLACVDAWNGAGRSLNQTLVEEIPGFSCNLVQQSGDKTGFIQILRRESGGETDRLYSVQQLNRSTGEWNVDFLNLNQPFFEDKTINAAAVYVDEHIFERDGHGAIHPKHVIFAAIMDKNGSSSLCAIAGSDNEEPKCFDTKLKTFVTKANKKTKETRPLVANAAAIIDNNYYYGRDQPDYWVENINTSNPIFHEVKFVVNVNWKPEIPGKSIMMDFTFIPRNTSLSLSNEEARYLDPDDESAAYIVSLGKYNVLYLVQINSAGYPGKYAAIKIDDSDIWKNETEIFSDTSITPYGAAFTYYKDSNFNDDAAGIFFTANNGKGTFELDMNTLYVPKDCWNIDGDDDKKGVDDQHTLCVTNPLDPEVVERARATLYYTTTSDSTNYNDGINCPDFSVAICEPGCAVDECGVCCGSGIPMSHCDCAGTPKKTCKGSGKEVCFPDVCKKCEKKCDINETEADKCGGCDNPDICRPIEIGCPYCNCEGDTLDCLGVCGGTNFNCTCRPVPSECATECVTTTPELLTTTLPPDVLDLTTTLPPGVLDLPYCDEYSNPMQIIKADANDEFYTLREFDPTTGLWQTRFDMSMLPAESVVNAADMRYHHGKDEIFAAISFSDFKNESNEVLCHFDPESDEERPEMQSFIENNCNPTVLNPSYTLNGENTFVPNSGIVVGNNYYYGRNAPQYWVEHINSEEPTYHMADEYSMNIEWPKEGTRWENMLRTNLKAAVKDFVSINVQKTDTDILVTSGGEGRGTYLLGLGTFEILYVIEINTDGTYGRYAAVPLTIDWNDANQENAMIKTSYGAAYKKKKMHGVDVYFSANKGTGMFKLIFPIQLPDTCWFESETKSTEAPSLCLLQPTAELKWTARTAVTEFNDGLHCDRV
jgi:hypothetical protein